LPFCDFWAELDAKIEEGERIKDAMAGAGGSGGKSNVFSRAEWDAARKKHREKVGK
jgi:hypothetical protein